ncbi:MAG: hypothetical protein EB059_04885 [Alphaproteobacteria bacterium]|nr:hypothetical protein [Alphaproteobacteria bacterium]
MSGEQNDKERTDWLVPEIRLVSVGTITRYSRIVGSLKLILPIAAACILLVLVVVPNINGSNVEPKPLTAVDAAMVAPVYNSRDAQNRPFEIKADTARQQPNAAGATNLANPKAVIDLGNGKQINAEGTGAVYNEKSGDLNVQHGLTLRHSDGTTFTTEEAHIDINGKNAQGDKPATLQGSFGEVRGEGFKTLDGGKTIIFTGKSSATLKMGGSKKDDVRPQNNNVNGGLPSPSKNEQNAPTAPSPSP